MIHILQRRSDLFVKHVYGYDQSAVRQIQIKTDLILRRERMHHICNCPDPADCIKSIQHLRDIRHAQCYGIIPFDPECSKCSGSTFDPFDKLFI